MDDIAIRVEGLGKRFRLRHATGGPRYRTFREDLLGLPRRLLNGLRGKGGEQEEFWALKDVSFEVKRGEVLGIIGRNGAGKSTLLKVLSRIMDPTCGEATVHGRIGSLLEVGTGFHPELTGRENIFLSGALLGMKRDEVRRRFDEIVAFAGVEKFLDTPCKHYSSGMYTRLGFAVAAHLDTEILLVDEVLAVGDAEFQRKCLDKMGSLSHVGRTVLLVSHNMAAIQSMSKVGVCLHEGRITCSGKIRDVVADYARHSGATEPRHYDASKQRRTYVGNQKAELLAFWFGRETTVFAQGEDLVFSLRLRAHADIGRIRISLTIKTRDGMPVGSGFSHEIVGPGRDVTAEYDVTLGRHMLAPGFYMVSVAIGEGDHLTGHTDFDVVENVLFFEVATVKGNGRDNVGWVGGWGNVIFDDLTIATAGRREQ